LKLKYENHQQESYMNVELSSIGKNSLETQRKKTGSFLKLQRRLKDV
jgi:hypothetical protein